MFIWGMKIIKKYQFWSNPGHLVTRVLIVTNDNVLYM